MRWSGRLIGLIALTLSLSPASALGQVLSHVGRIRSPGLATTEASTKIVSRLRSQLADLRADELSRGNVAATDLAARLSSRMLKVDNGGRVHVYVSVADATENSLNALRRHGLDIEIVNPDLRVVQGWVPAAHLDALAAEAVVVKVRPPSYGERRAVGGTPAGDSVDRCDRARAMGITGAGAQVGVVSDGVDGLAASQASAVLPTVRVLSPGTGNEGTAMLEIIHSCAPGAGLAFSEGLSSSLAFIASVDALRDAGAKIIVDDIAFYGEPFFEDGAVALNDRAIGGSVLRVSAAGNDRWGHYQGFFRPGMFDPEVSGSRHDFGGGDTLLPFSVAALPQGTTATIVLQWGNRFGGAGDDYDLCVRRSDGTLVGCSALVQDGNDDPIEFLEVKCTGPSGSSCPGHVEVTLFSGLPRALELFCFPSSCRLEKLTVAADSIFGHAAVPEVLAVAASPASQPTVIEPFSSAGPATILFPIPEVRQKPDLTGPDGVATTQPGLSPFFGTSAAAPHVAGVAALATEANPSYQLFPSFLRGALKSSAVDLGPAGPDSDFGFGRADALNEVQNELGKARCEVRSDRTRVPVGQPFNVTVDTFPGTGDPWDIYLVMLVSSPPPVTFFSVDLASGGFGPTNVMQRARSTAPVSRVAWSFGYTALAPAEVGFFCILVDPGISRINRHSFAPVSLTASP